MSYNGRKFFFFVNVRVGARYCEFWMFGFLNFTDYILFSFLSDWLYSCKFDEDPDPMIPDPTRDNGYIKLFSSWTKYKPEPTNSSYNTIDRQKISIQEISWINPKLLIGGLYFVLSLTEYFITYSYRLLFGI